MRGLVASVASVRDAAELTVETMGGGSPVVGFRHHFPGLQSRFVNRLNAGSVWSQVPGAGVGILEAWLFSAAVVHERTKDGIWMVERGGVDGNNGDCSLPYHVGAVDFLVLDVEELEFVNELPVSAQMPIGCGAESWGLGVGEVSLHMDEGRDAVVILMAPRLGT